MQLTHQNSRFKKHTFPIVLICENISNAPNIGSLFRTADAFGVESIFFCGDDIPLGKRMKKTSRSTENHVPFTTHSNIYQLLDDLKTDYHVIGLEITSQSKPLHSCSFSSAQPIALIIGNENFGLSDSVLDQCNEVVHIEMFGYNSSMNVVQATSVALFEITRQLIY